MAIDPLVAGLVGKHDGGFGVLRRLDELQVVGQVHGEPVEQRHLARAVAERSGDDEGVLQAVETSSALAQVELEQSAQPRQRLALHVPVLPGASAGQGGVELGSSMRRVPQESPHLAAPEVQLVDRSLGGRGWQGRGEVEAGRIVDHGDVDGVDPAGLGRREASVGEGACEFTGLGQVSGQEPVALRGPVREAGLEGMGDPTVQLSPPFRGQRAVGGLLDQDVFEAVLRAGASDELPRGDRLVAAGLLPRPDHPRRLERRRRGDRHGTADRAPKPHGAPNGRRAGSWSIRQSNTFSTVSGISTAASWSNRQTPSLEGTERSGSDEGADELLDIERVALGRGQDSLRQLIGQRVGPDQGRQQLAVDATGECAEVDLVAAVGELPQGQLA